MEKFPTPESNEEKSPEDAEGNAKNEFIRKRRELREKAERVIVPVETIIPDIKAALTDSRPRRKEEINSSVNPQSYADGLSRNVKDVEGFQKFFEDFRGQIVVDLGAGTLPYGYSIAVINGAKAYVGVDEYHGDFLKSMMPSKIVDFKIENPIPAAVEQQDMLNFLRRLPDKSVSVLASGIDGTIITDKKYAEDVNKELARVLHPQGSFVGYASRIWPAGDTFERQNFSDAFEEDSLVDKRVRGIEKSELEKSKLKKEIDG